MSKVTGLLVDFPSTLTAMQEYSPAEFLVTLRKTKDCPLGRKILAVEF